MSIAPIDSQMKGVLWSQTSKEPDVQNTTSPISAEYDLAVVGGGFCGLSIALHASLQGLSVILIEAGKIGNGASGRNGGFAVPQFPGAMLPSDVEKLLGSKKANRLCEIVGGGPAFMFDQINTYGIQCDPEQNGWVQPAHSNRTLSRVRTVFQEWKALGADVQWLDSDQIKATLGASGYLGGWLAHEGGAVNPYALCQGLARVAVKNGAHIIQNAPVTEIKSNGSIKNVRIADFDIRARKVAITTNGYTSSLYPGLKKSVIPVRLFHTFTKPLTAEQQRSVLPSRVCCTDLRKSGGVARYDAAGRLISAGAVFSIGDAKTNAEKHVKKRIRLIFPQLVNPEIEYYWEGYCAYSKTHLPSVQILDQDVYAILGFSTRGVSLAQNLGKEFASYLAENITLDDVPVQVGGLDEIPLQGTLSTLGGYAFPALKAMDWLRLS